MENKLINREIDFSILDDLFSWSVFVSELMRRVFLRRHQKNGRLMVDHHLKMVKRLAALFGDTFSDRLL